MGTVDADTEALIAKENNEMKENLMLYTSHWDNGNEAPGTRCYPLKALGHNTESHSSERRKKNTECLNRDSSRANSWKTVAWVTVTTQKMLQL